MNVRCAVRRVLLQFGLTVHHDRTYQATGFFERLCRTPGGSEFLFAGCTSLVAAIEQHQRAVTGLFAHDGFR